MISVLFEAAAGLALAMWAIDKANRHGPDTPWSARLLMAGLGGAGVLLALRAAGWPWWP